MVVSWQLVEWWQPKLEVEEGEDKEDEKEEKRE